MSTSTPSLSIDVVNDLSSVSAIKALLKKDQTAIFQIFEEWAGDSSKSIQQAANDKASANVTLTTDASWSLPVGIIFSLTPTAKCTISVDTVSKTFAIAMNIDSTGTQNVLTGPTTGLVYINIDLDFSIEVDASGSGTVSGIGISGKAAGSAATTFSFCQPVDATLPAPDAIKNAFEKLVFPFDPSCTNTMQSGALSKVAFDGTINCELDVTYGLGDYKVAAPDTTSVQKALGNLVKLKAPSFETDAGVSGTLTYAHTDHFAIVVNKTTDTAAVLYLLRSSEDDWGGSVGVSVGITTSAPSVTVNQAQLQTVAQNVTGNATLASAIAKAAVQPINPLQTSLNARLKAWASDVTGTVGLSVALARQTGHTTLFIFDIDLTQPDLAKASWTALIGGSVIDALNQKGFALQTGSGVADNLKKSATLQFQFFNFFSFTQVSDYFSNGYTELGKDGTIRIHCDLGNEVATNTKTAMEKFRIYFAATATQNTSGTISQVAADLCIELSENGNSNYANALANVIGFLPGSQAVNGAQNEMIQFVAGTPSGTLDLLVTFKNSAYQKLTSSPYVGNTPADPPQQQDQDNWLAFQRATATLMPDIPFIGNLSYNVWATYNVTCWDQAGSTETPDRHQIGDWGNGIDLLTKLQFSSPDVAGYYLRASQGFMNLCDDLKTLAAGLADVENSSQWKDLLGVLTQITTQDDYIVYTQPIAAALLELCSAGGAQTSVSTTKSKDASSLTCTMAIA